jgi:hypothetical protein
LNYKIINNGNIANGFSFEIGNFFAVGTGVVDMTVGFNLMAPGATIDSVNLTQVGATANGGIASIGELVCLGGSVITCPSQDTRSLTTISSGSLTGSIHFDPVEEIGVTKNISAIGNGGFASISQIFETADQVPEPSFYGALVFGVALLLVHARRRKRTAEI